MGMASAGVNQVVEMADEVTDKAIDAIAELEDAAVSAGHAAVAVGDKVFDEALNEVRSAKKHLLEAIRKLSSAVTDQLP